MRILALNGGGTLGYIIAGILEKIESEFKKPASEMFDLITGLSTGSIIGSSLALGISAEEVKEKYRDLASKIFTKPRGFIGSLFWSKYKIEKLEEILKENMKDAKLSEARTNLMINAVNISDRLVNTRYWKSWKEDEDLYKIVCASCAAPTFFDPYEIAGRYYIDGGIAENNPTISSIAEGIKLNYRLEEIECFNIWAFTTFGIKEPKKFTGLLDVGSKISNLFTAGGGDSNKYQAKRILGDRYMGIGPTFDYPIDSKEFEKFEDVIDNVWEMKKYDIIRFLGE